MTKAPTAAALALLLAAALPLAGAGRDCSKMTEAQVYAKSTKVIHQGKAALTYRVCVCDAEPVVELIADDQVVAVVQGGQCADATGAKIEVRASPDRGATVGYTQIPSTR